ncbi:hypothetical protein JCM3770_003686 [Rhodotorula araucariae]
MVSLPRRPLYSELYRAFSALRPSLTSAPAHGGAQKALAHAWASAGGPRQRAVALRAAAAGSEAKATSTAALEHARLLVQGRDNGPRRWASCSAPGCPNIPQASRTFASTSSTPASPASPPGADAPRPVGPESHALTKPEPHPLARPVPHPLVKSEPHPLVASPSTPAPAYLSSLSRSIRRAAANLPSAAGRPPPKDQLLSLTNSFFERLKIRFKWATIRSYRRFRADDYSAFFSFGILGTLGWFLLKTTSAFAVLFFVVNSLSLQEWLAGKLGAYLTDSTGVKVVFESAIVPKWGIFGQGGSRIVFRNVYISRGPVKGELGVLPVEGEETEETEEEARLREMVAQWTHFHLSIDTVEVSLSLGRWLDGKGLIKDAAVRGVRGIIERSHIVYDPTAPKDRFAYRNKPRPGDFWLEGLQIEDFLVTIYQPENFRPYTFSIFHADIPRFRKQWLFYDLMSADTMTGQCDNCLFSLHRPQSIGRTSEEEMKDARWSRMSRFRVDGVPIDHMQSTSDTGVLSWITSGRCDLVADIRFPREDTELDLSALVDHLVDEIGGVLGADSSSSSAASSSAAAGATGRIPGRRSLSRDALTAPPGTEEDAEQAKAERKKALRFAKESEKAAAGELGAEGVEEQVAEVGEADEDKIVSIDLDVRFKDLKASVPYFTSDLSYINNALIRPIVAFINRNRTLIPIHCHIDLGLSEFNGSWTTYDVGILDRMSEQVYAALAHHVSQSNEQRLQTVGLWTLQMTANTVLGALKNNFTLAPY